MRGMLLLVVLALILLVLLVVLVLVLLVLVLLVELLILLVLPATAMVMVVVATTTPQAWVAACASSRALAGDSWYGERNGARTACFRSRRRMRMWRKEKAWERKRIRER